MVSAEGTTIAAQGAHRESASSAAPGEPVASAPAVRLRDVRRTYGEVVAIDSLTLDVRAGAIVNRPRVLLLDEPLGALDLKLRQEMQLELKSIQRELSERITFIYVTHDQDEALTMSDRIAVFSDGRIEQVGTPGEVYESPANEFVAGFVGTSNIVELEGRRFTVRPEKVRLLSAGETAQLSATGIVREVSYLGPITRYLVELDRGGTLVVVRQNLDMSAARALEERGRRVGLVWRDEDASRLDTNQQEDGKP